MCKYLVTAGDWVSEWLLNFGQVQVVMNVLEQQGLVSNVLVQKFHGDKLEHEITYDFDGQEWVKRSKK